MKIGLGVSELWGRKSPSPIHWPMDYTTASTRSRDCQLLLILLLIWEMAIDHFTFMISTSTSLRLGMKLLLCFMHANKKLSPILATKIKA